MIGFFQGFRVARGSFGQQYTTIDGQLYLTWFDLCDPKLRGLRPGCRVQYDARPSPTVLCHSPHITEHLPSATLSAVLAADSTLS